MTGVGSVKGIGAGLFGVAASDNMTGLVIGGVGADGDCRGIGIGGVGVGAGGTLRGIMVAGIGVGAEEMRGLALAPVLFRTERGGRLIGGSISAVNAVRGEQRGITVGVVNYARSLQGAQLGIVNVVRDNPRGRRVLPILNWGRDR